MDIRLNYLKIKNFKGIKEFLFKIDSKNANVRGDNATGKTSLYDAFLWLLFDKNSDNSTKFTVKPTDDKGEEIHFLETEVEAELEVDGKPIKLKKVLTENWVKPKGQTEKVFKGNIIDCYFDEVPVKKGEYQEKIAELIDEEVFKLITNPLYFNDDTAFTWQKRREKLFEICGGMSDEEIINTVPKLKELPTILNGKSVDERKTIIKGEIKALDKEISSIGPKIIENMRLIPSTQPDYERIEAELEKLGQEYKAVENQILNAANIAKEYREKQQKLYSLKGLLEEVKIKIDNEANAGYKQLLTDKQNLLTEKGSLESEIRSDKSIIELNRKAIERNNTVRTRLLNEWTSLTQTLKETQAEEFIEPDDSNFICPTCKQSLPQEVKEQKLAEMKANFNQYKQSRIADIQNKLNTNVSQGKAVKAEIEELKNEIRIAETRIKRAESRLSEINNKLDEVEQKLAVGKVEPDYMANAEYAEIYSKIEQLKAELDKPVEDKTKELLQKRNEIEVKINECEAILQERNLIQKTKERIEQLKQQEKELSAEKATLEGQLFLIEEFIRTKTDILSEAINKRFKHVRFKLFEQLQNGNIAETCQTLINTNGCWVPYSDGNTAGKINAGIDVINSLIEFYGVSAPLFIDNAEAVTDIIPVNAQVIKLIKPEIVTDEDRQKYSKLVVEIKEN